MRGGVCRRCLSGRGCAGAAFFAFALLFFRAGRFRRLPALAAAVPVRAVLFGVIPARIGCRTAWPVPEKVPGGAFVHIAFFWQFEKKFFFGVCPWGVPGAFFAFFWRVFVLLSINA